jgi:hypothetical protein
MPTNKRWRRQKKHTKNKTKTKKRGGTLAEVDLNKTLPSKGPAILPGTMATFFLNPIGLNGGSDCGGLCMRGGDKHRDQCRCSECKIKQNGGDGSSYPNGLVGNAWTSSVETWPGVNGVQGDSNHYALNTYPTDISRQMTPSNTLIKGGTKRTKKQRGGSNLLMQDLVNFGRQIQFGIGSAYNAISGYPAPVNPLPFKDQMTHARADVIKQAIL